MILLGGDAFEFSELLDKVTDIVEAYLGGDFCNTHRIGQKQGLCLLNPEVVDVLGTAFLRDFFENLGEIAVIHVTAIRNLPNGQMFLIMVGNIGKSPADIVEGVFGVETQFLTLVSHIANNPEDNLVDG